MTCLIRRIGDWNRKFSCTMNGRFLAAIAATNIGPAELQGLEEAIAIMAADISAGAQRVASEKDGDFLFHSRIAAVSRNTVLQSMV